MKFALLIVLPVILGACTAQQTAQDNDQEQAVRDFIAVRGLEPLDRIRTSDRDSWDVIDDHFVIYAGRRDSYLFEFVRACYEIQDNTHIVADERWDGKTIRARFDTLRGCRIDNIYALTDEEVAELTQLGEPPGSRN